MRTPSAPELLAAWERGQAASHVERALLLLAAGEPGETAGALAALSIGRRDARLLLLRERLFGPRLESLTACPACGERLELALEVADLLGEADSPDPPVEGLWLELGDRRVRFRLPTSHDLIAVSSAESAHAALLERCVEEVQGEGPWLPSQLAAPLAARMAEVDPVADLELALHCPACDERWAASFDVVSYLWAELDAWAQRALREVHLLARAYGWSEASILSLSPSRRLAYLEMVGA